MAKEKKISVKCTPVKSKDENIYNVYYRAVYNKKSTRFPSRLVVQASSIDEAKERVENNSKDFNTNRVIKVIRKEIDKKGDKYTIVGFGERWPFYLIDLYGFFSQMAVKKLMDKLKNILIFNQYINTVDSLQIQSPVLSLYRMNNSLILQDLLEFLEQEYNFNIDSIIDEEIFRLAVLSVSLDSFHEKEKSLAYNVSQPVVDIDAFINPKTIEFSLADWIGNIHNARHRFFNYINEKGLNKIEGDSKFLKSKFKNKFSISNEIFHTSINKYIEEYINEYVFQIFLE